MSQLTQVVKERLRAVGRGKLDRKLLTSLLDDKWDVFTFMQLTSLDDKRRFYFKYAEELEEFRHEDPEALCSLCRDGDYLCSVVKVGLEKTLMLIEEELKHVSD